MKKCGICGKEYTGEGNNPAPFKTEEVCEICNWNFVIPSRYNIISKKAVLFTTTGYMLELKPKNNYFSLKELQSYAKGLIEFYPEKVNDNLVICNEEGLILGLKPNKLFEKYSGIRLVGDIVLCPNELLEPEEE